MAVGATLAAKSLGRRLLTTGADGQIPALEAVAAGDLAATVDVDPYRMGAIAMQVVLDSFKGSFKGGWVETATTIRDISNVRDGLRRSELVTLPSAKGN
jgi:ribose transport system substrate-binding protein